MSGFLAGMMQFKGLIVNGHSGCISLHSGVGIFKYSTKFELNGLIHMKMQQVFFLGGEDDLLKLTHFPLDSVKFRNLWCVKGGFISCLFPPQNQTEVSLFCSRHLLRLSFPIQMTMLFSFFLYSSTACVLASTPVSSCKEVLPLCQWLCCKFEEM